MAKTNFTKVETALSDGLQKLTVKQLLEMTEGPIPEERPPVEACRAIVKSIQKELARLHKIDAGTYKKLKIPRSDLKKFINNPSALSVDDWKTIKQIKERVDAFKKELESKLPQPTDDDIVENERKKHVNKRFNVQDKWLPLK